MENQNRLGVIDWAVAPGCVALILVTLGAVGESGRGRAKEYVCQANLKQWNGVFQGIIEENDGQFLSGVTGAGYWWPIQLSQELQDWKRNRTWFCPTATVPQWNEHGMSSGQLSIFDAWGIFSDPMSVTYDGKTYVMNSHGLAGSYALNGYTLDIVKTYEGGLPASEGWSDLQGVPEPSRVPLFIDALRFDLWPRHTDAPAVSESAALNGNHMAHSCINRHNGAVNCLFVDGSVRKVGLKELWTLRWHRSFETAGLWTKAGGVQPTDWPQWMQSFKDY